MIKRYLIADHLVSLEMPQSPLWDRLSNYVPFESTAEGEPVFHLEVCDISTDAAPSRPEAMKPVLVGAAEPGAPRLDLYSDGSLWWVEMAPVDDRPVCAWLTMSSDMTRGSVRVSMDSDNGRFAVDNSMMLLFAFRTSVMGTLEMHSSVVVRGGRGFMFLGRSGTGKSTHSRMWLKHLDGVHLLNDDNPVIRIGADGKATVYGTPWSGKTPCYRNESVPVGAIVRIRQCPDNRIQKQNVMEAYASIFSSCSGFRAVRSMADGLHSTISALVTGVPCYILDCRPDGDAARVCSEEVDGN